jgi:biotin transport system substrate-specific component
MGTSVLSRRVGARHTVVGVVGFAAAVALAAQVAIPLPGTPVPVTLQPMLVVLAGLWLGPTAGVASMLLYLAAGAAGLPAFTPVGAPGVARLLGPTGGYLMSYPVAALLTGYLAERGFEKRYFTSCLAMLAGLAVVMTFGVTWLALFAQPAAVGFDSALRLGLYPFLLNDVLKIVLGGALLPGVWKLVGRADS